jgi:hypothetical protein
MLWVAYRRRPAGLRSVPVAATIPASWLVVAVVIVLIAACTTIYPYGATHFSSTESEARFVSVVMPLYGGAAVLLRRRPALASMVVSVSVVAAVLFQVLYNLGYWMT